MQREILRGRYRHYLTPEQRKAHCSPGLHPIKAHQSISEDQLWLRRVLTLAGADEKGQKMKPESHSLWSNDDETWLEHMLALAGDSGQEDQNEEETEYQSDEALMDDFIHRRGEFAL